MPPLFERQQPAMQSGRRRIWRLPSTGFLTVAIQSGALQKPPFGFSVGKLCVYRYAGGYLGNTGEDGEHAKLHVLAQ